MATPMKKTIFGQQLGKTRNIFERTRKNENEKMRHAYQTNSKKQKSKELPQKICAFSLILSQTKFK